MTTRTRLLSVHYYRIGDRLLLATEGAHSDFGGRIEHHDVHWMTIPLPEACRGLGDYRHEE